MPKYRPVWQKLRTASAIQITKFSQNALVITLLIQVLIAMDVWNNATVYNDNEVSKLEDEIKRLKARLEALKKHDQ